MLTVVADTINFRSEKLGRQLFLVRTESTWHYQSLLECLLSKWSLWTRRNCGITWSFNWQVVMAKMKFDVKMCGTTILSLHLYEAVLVAGRIIARRVPRAGSNLWTLMPAMRGRDVLRTLSSMISTCWIWGFGCPPGCKNVLRNCCNRLPCWRMLALW